MDNQFKKTLEQEVPKWVAEGLISEEKGALVLSKYEYVHASNPLWSWFISIFLVFIGVFYLLNQFWYQWDSMIQYLVLIGVALTGIMMLLLGTMKRPKGLLNKEVIGTYCSMATLFLLFFGAATYGTEVLQLGVSSGQSVGGGARPLGYLNQLLTTNSTLYLYFTGGAILLTLLISGITRSIGSTILYYTLYIYSFVFLKYKIEQVFPEHVELIYILMVVFLCTPLLLAYYWIQKKEYKKTMIFFWPFSFAAIGCCTALMSDREVILFMPLVTLAIIMGYYQYKGGRSVGSALRIMGYISLFVLTGTTLPHIVVNGSVNSSLLHSGIHGMFSLNFNAWIASAVFAIIAFLLVLRVPMDSADRLPALAISVFTIGTVVIVGAEHVSYLNNPLASYAYIALLGVLAAFFVIYGLLKDYLRYFNVGLLFLLIFTDTVQTTLFLENDVIFSYIIIAEGIFFALCNLFMIRRRNSGLSGALESADGVAVVDFEAEKEETDEIDPFYDQIRTSMPLDTEALKGDGEGVAYEGPVPQGDKGASEMNHSHVTTMVMPNIEPERAEDLPVEEETQMTIEEALQRSKEETTKNEGEEAMDMSVNVSEETHKETQETQGEPSNEPKYSADGHLLVSLEEIYEESVQLPSKEKTEADVLRDVEVDNKPKE